MKNKISLADELAQSMQDSLDEKIDHAPGMELAVEQLNSAADLFEDANMSFASEYITSLLEKIAAKEDKIFWFLSRKSGKNDRVTRTFKGTKEKLDAHLEKVEPVNGKWNVDGPYSSMQELEKEHYPEYSDKGGK